MLEKLLIYNAFKLAFRTNVRTNNAVSRVAFATENPHENTIKNSLFIHETSLVWSQLRRIAEESIEPWSWDVYKWNTHYLKVQ